MIKVCRGCCRDFTKIKDRYSKMMETIIVYMVQGPYCRQSINNRYKHGGRQVSNSGRDNTVAHGQLNSQHLFTVIFQKSMLVDEEVSE